MSDPDIQQAQRALEALSQDRRAREEAARRAWEIHFYQAGLRQEREAGFDEGRKLGIDEGRKLGEKRGIDKGKSIGRIEATAEVLGLELDQDRRARIDAASSKELEALLQHLREHHRWPE